jgi:hypothetical protein
MKYRLVSPPTIQLEFLEPCLCELRKALLRRSEKPANGVLSRTIRSCAKNIDEFKKIPDRTPVGGVLAESRHPAHIDHSVVEGKAFEGDMQNARECAPSDIYTAVNYRPRIEVDLWKPYSPSPRELRPP